MKYYMEICMIDTAAWFYFEISVYQFVVAFFYNAVTFKILFSNAIIIVIIRMFYEKNEPFNHFGFKGIIQ